VVGLVLIRI